MYLKRKFKALYERARFHLSANNHPIFIWNYKYFFYPKEGSLAYFLGIYSGYKNNDVYILQVGANDGMTHDPMHKYIKRDKWGGVLLEPQKYVYDQFLSKIYQKDDNVTTVNAALGKEDGTLTLYKVAFCNQRWATGLASFSLPALKESFDNGYVLKESKINKVEVPANEEEWITEEQVEVVCMASLLKRYAKQKIDLVQIDTEGFDFEVIKMIDFDHLNPDIISFERTHFSDEAYQECSNLLEANGYMLRKIGRNTLAVKSGIRVITDQFALPEKELKR